MIYRQQPGAPWDPRQTPGVQPGARLLFAEEFARGGAPVPLAPNGQKWIGQPGWLKWDAGSVIARAYIDAAREAGVVSIGDPGEGLGQSFAGMYRAAPTPPAGASSYDYTIYSRVMQLDSAAGAAAIAEALWGTFITPAALPADGPFVLAGASVRADAVPVPDTPSVLSTQETPSRLGPTLIPALVGEYHIPGPSPGFIRIICEVIFTVGDTIPGHGAPLATISAQLNPGAYQLVRLANTGGSGASSGGLGLFATTNRCWPIGPDETIDITNTGPGACSITVTYYDVPDTNLTLVRLNCVPSQTLPLTNVVLIPAVTAGFKRRFISLISPNTNFPQPSLQVAAASINDDTTNHNWVMEIGGVRFEVGFNSGAGATFDGRGWGTGTVIRGDSLQGRIDNVPMTLRPCPFIACYETLPDV